MTHTYAILDVSPEAYREIRAKLEAAGYSLAIRAVLRSQGAEEVIDMHGIALRAEEDVFPNDEHGRPWLRNSNAFHAGCKDCVDRPRSVTLCDEHAGLAHRSHPCAGCGLRRFFESREGLIASADADWLCPACEVKLPPAYAAWLATQENDGA